MKFPHNTRKQVEPPYAKAGLEIFIIAIPKEGLVGTSLAKTSFGLTTTVRSKIAC